MKTIRIVCFGGGNGVPRVVLAGLKRYPCDITSVTSMTDDGGSTGALRQEFGVLPPGDIRRHILALSEAPKWKKELWGWRFGSETFADGHRGHSFGNVFLAGLEKSLGDYEKALEVACEFMELPKGRRALPATLKSVTLCAELESGEVVEGEGEIDVPRHHDPSLGIKRVFLKPRAKAHEPVLDAIEKADTLVFGPGDLYSSLLPCFLPQGVKAAIATSSARKILVTNIMTKRGETDDFAVEDFAGEVEKYIGAELDHVLYNTTEPEVSALVAARKEDGSVGEAVVLDEETGGEKYVGADLLLKGTLNSDPKKTGRSLWKLING